MTFQVLLQDMATKDILTCLTQIVDGLLLVLTKSVAEAESGTLSVSIPELDIEHLAYKELNNDHPYAQKQHPLTRTCSHYVAYDRFHQENTTSRVEILRQLDIVPQCRGINSQVVEELFSSLGRSAYFLTQLSPVHHVFIIRLILHLWNKKHNQDKLKTIEKQVSAMNECSMSFGADQRVIISGREPGERRLRFYIIILQYITI